MIVNSMDRCCRTAAGTDAAATAAAATPAAAAAATATAAAAAAVAAAAAAAVFRGSLVNHAKMDLDSRGGRVGRRVDGWTNELATGERV